MRARWLLAGGLAVAVAVAGWLYRDNRRLRAELASLRPAAGAGAKAAGDAAADGDERAAGGAESGRARPSRLASARSFLSALGRAQQRQETEGNSAATARDSAPAPEETRAERRRRRQDDLAAFLGRRPGETADEYRARMKPLVAAGLAAPRGQLEGYRRDAEAAAGVTPEQHAQLDEAFTDVYAETMELANRAIAGGELTPYRRNVAGALTFVGGLGAVLSGAEGRIGEVLTPEQQQIMYDQGFDWGEYLGTQVPWENLEPPPPPDGGGS